MRVTTMLAVTGLILITGCGSGGGRSGELRSVSDVPRVTVYGSDPGDHLSATVSGDFTGDGTTDLAVGSAFADGPDNDRIDSGEIYVFVGPFEAGDVLEAGVDAAFVVYGAGAYGTFGRALSSGDYNADGVDDIAVGAPFEPARSAEEPGPGTVYVLYGAEDLPTIIDLATDPPSVTIAGDTPADATGLYLATADVTGDNVDDLVLGASLGDGLNLQRQDAGEIHIVAGDSMRAEMTMPVDATSTVTGAAAGDRLGETFTVADVTGDGLGDLIAAAPFADGAGEADSGEVYVVESPLSGTFDLATSASYHRVSGADAGDQVGHSLAAPDWNQDGKADLWLGSVSADGLDNAEDLAGEAHLVFAGSVGATDLSDVDSITLGPAAGARFGRNGATGELDSKAGEDAVFSAPDVAQRAGIVYILSSASKVPTRADAAALGLAGVDPGDILGHEAFGTPSLAVADLDEDGVSELIVAAPEGDGAGNDKAESGEVYVLFVNLD